MNFKLLNASAAKWVGLLYCYTTECSIICLFILCNKACKKLFAGRRQGYPAKRQVSPPRKRLHLRSVRGNKKDCLGPGNSNFVLYCYFQHDQFAVASLRHFECDQNHSMDLEQTYVRILLCIWEWTQSALTDFSLRKSICKGLQNDLSRHH